MKIDEVQKALAEAKAAHHAGKPVEPGLIKGLSNELNRQLTEGAKNCKDCGGKPLAIIQPVGIEIGCPICRNHRVKKSTRELAVAAWNQGEFLAPRGE